MKKLLALLLATSIQCGQPTPDTKNFDTDVYETCATLAQVLALLEEKHYCVQDLTECMYEAFDSLMACADPHSSFLSPKSYKNILTTMNGQFCGIGVVIDATRQTKDPFLRIISVIPEGPADHAGLKELDNIAEIDGHKLEGMSTDEATAMLKGKKGTTVTIRVLRDNKGAEKGDILTFTIERDIIKDQNARSFILPDNHICYVGFSIFNEHSANQFERILQEADKQKCTGLILDLRNNAGGLLQAAIDHAGIILDKGSLIVTTKDKKGAILERYVTKRNPIHCKIPFMVILMNNYTASAAEILAGALKIHCAQQKKKPVVILVGSKTFGKGSVQEIIPLANGCAVKITISLYYLPDNTCIQAVGILPHIAIERTSPLSEHIGWFTTKYGREESLKHAIKQEKQEKIALEQSNKKGDAITTKNMIDRLKEQLENDNQFQESVTIINLLHAMHKTAPKTIANQQTTVDFLQNIYKPVKSNAIIELKIEDNNQQK